MKFSKEADGPLNNRRLRDQRKRIFQETKKSFSVLFVARTKNNLQREGQGRVREKTDGKSQQKWAA